MRILKVVNEVIKNCLRALKSCLNKFFFFFVFGGKIILANRLAKWQILLLAAKFLHFAILHFTYRNSKLWHDYKLWLEKLILSNYKWFVTWDERDTSQMSRFTKRKELIVPIAQQYEKKKKKTAS